MSDKTAQGCLIIVMLGLMVGSSLVRDCRARKVTRQQEEQRAADANSRRTMIRDYGLQYAPDLFRKFEAAEREKNALDMQIEKASESLREINRNPAKDQDIQKWKAKSSNLKHGIERLDAALVTDLVDSLGRQKLPDSFTAHLYPLMKASDAEFQALLSHYQKARPHDSVLHEPKRPKQGARKKGGASSKTASTATKAEEPSKQQNAARKQALENYGGKYAPITLEAMKALNVVADEMDRRSKEFMSAMQILNFPLNIYPRYAAWEKKLNLIKELQGRTTRQLEDLYTLHSKYVYLPDDDASN